jgi:hypothetical protein
MFYRMIAKKYRHLPGGEGGIFLGIRVLKGLFYQIVKAFL